MDFVEAAGHRLEVDRIEAPAGASVRGRPTLIFLHEGLGCVSAWRGFPREIAAATGCPALVYSRRGYGQSEAAPGPWPLTFMHDEAERVLPALFAREGIEDAVLIGHSDGASIALIHASEVQRGVRGVVAIAPHVFVEDVCVRAIAALRVAYADPTTGVRSKLARHHADVDGTFRAWAAAWLDPEFLKWDLTGFLPRVRVPVMALQGTDDAYGTLRQIDAVCAGVAGPAERVVLTGSGHVPQKDAPEATAAAIVRFVRAVSS